MKEEHAEQAMEELKKWGDTSKVHWVQCNLEDLKWVDEVAKKLKSDEKQIDAVRSPLFPPGTPFPRERH